MRKKQVGAICLSVVTAVSVLSGCGGGTNALEVGSTTAAASGSEEKADDMSAVFDLTPGNLPIVVDREKAPTFKIARSRDPLQTIDTSELVMSKRLEEETGVKISWEEIPTVGYFK